MGVVYRAMSRASGQTFALKVLNERMGLNRGAVSILQNEAHAQSSIVHPNVVRVFEFVQGNRTSAIVMEFVGGPNVEIFVNQHPGRRVNAGEAAWLAMHMANGLAVVHHQGLVHADVKAANFMFGTMYGGHNVLKVADFGIARSLESQLKLRAGTPGYMSPEQIRGEHLTASSDIYSLGCVLHELLTGRPVFPGQTTEELQHHHLSTPVPDLSTAAPPHLTPLLTSMLAKSPNHRIQSMLAIVESLRNYAIPPKEFE
jgi:serine/threonine-protein kinase